MNKNPQIGCNANWDEMLPVVNSENRFCHLCSHEIYDITNKSEEEINGLRVNSNGKFCVKANIWQIEEHGRRNKFIKYSRFRKIGMIGLLLFGNIFNSNIFGQNQNSNEVELTETIPDKIIIKGKTNRIKKFGIKKGFVTMVKIHNQEGLVIKEIRTDKNGRFEIEISKKVLGNKYSITAEAKGYRIAKMTTMEIENANVRLVLDKERNEQDVFYIGYM